MLASPDSKLWEIPKIREYFFGGLGFRVGGLGFRVWGLGFRGLRLRVWG